MWPALNFGLGAARRCSSGVAAAASPAAPRVQNAASSALLIPHLAPGWMGQTGTIVRGEAAGEGYSSSSPALALAALATMTSWMRAGTGS